MEESDKCGGLKSHVYSDTAIFDIYPFRTDEDVTEILSMLHYRARTQLSLFNVFIMLEQRGFVSFNNFRKFYVHPAVSNNTSPIAACLNTFEALMNEEKYELGPDEKTPTVLWNVQATSGYIYWLATMIVRSCTKVDKLFEAIEAFGILGGINKKAVNRYMKSKAYREFTCNADELVGKSSHAFGFWLPQGLGDIFEEHLYRKIYDSVQTFDRIERVYKDYFGISDEQLITEKHRDESDSSFRKYLRIETKCC